MQAYLERAKAPFKVALALTMALLLAAWFHLERPYWAGLAVVVMSMMETSGHALRKGKWRILGTFTGFFFAGSFSAFFAQNIGMMMVCFSLLVAICGYMMVDPKYGYLWSITATVCALILAMGNMNPITDFTVGVLRLEETALGVACYTVVFSLLWPKSSVPLFKQEVLSMLDQQQVNLVNRRQQLLDKNQPTVTRWVLGEGLKHMMRLQDLLYAAQSDSYDISREKKAWQYIIHIGDQWALAVGHVTEAIELLKFIDIEKNKPKIDALFEYILTNLRQCEAFIQGDISDELVLPKHQHMKLPILVKDDVATQGAVLLLERHLNQMASMSDGLVEAYYSACTGKPWKASAHKVEKVKSRFHLDFERTLGGLRGFFIVWLATGLWYWFNPPGGLLIVALSAIFGLTFVTIPFAKMKNIFMDCIGSGIIILVEYVFIIPSINSPYAVALFYFINVFLIWFLFNKPTQLLTRVLGSMLLIITTKTLMFSTPEYQPMVVLMIIIAFVISVLIIIFVNDFPFSHHPERVFLRQLNLLKQVLAWNLRDALYSGKKAPLSHRLGCLFFGVRPIKLVMSIEQASAAIRWKRFPELNVTQMSEIQHRLYILVLRVNSLKDGYMKWKLSSGVTSQGQMIVEDCISRIALALDKTNGYDDLLILEQEMNDLFQDIQVRLSVVGQQALGFYNVEKAELSSAFSFF
jgi:uncharacterized membrane protein YgaE (UPF0421/DUF939 family)